MQENNYIQKKKNKFYRENENSSKNTERVFDNKENAKGLDSQVINNINSTLETLVQSQQTLTSAMEMLVRKQTNNNPYPYPAMYFPYGMGMMGNTMPSVEQAENIHGNNNEVDISEYLTKIQQLEKDKEIVLEKYHKLELELQSKNIQQDNTELVKKIENLNEIIVEKDELIEQLQEQVQAGKENSNIIEMERVVEEITEKIKNYEEANAAIVQEMKADKNKISELENEVKKWKNEYDDMYYVANRDAKTDRQNANAFNEEFPKIELEKAVLGILAIDGLESFNLEYGKSAGDDAILCVSEELGKYYSDAQLYRTMGGQFFVLETEKMQKAVYDTLQHIQQLLQEQGISVVIAVVAGKQYSDHREVIEALDEKYIAAKKGAIQKFDEETDDTAKTASLESNKNTAETVEEQYFNTVDIEDDDDEIGEMRYSETEGIKDMTESYIGDMYTDFINSVND